MNKKVADDSEEIFTLNFNGSKNVVEILEDRICTNVSNITIELASGEAKLFLIKNGSASTANITSDFNALNETMVTNIINIQSGVDIINGSRDKFFAEQITLYPDVKIEAGTDVLLSSENSFCGSVFNRQVKGNPESISPKANLKVLPNPNNGDFNIKVEGDPEKEYSIHIETVLGQSVQIKKARGNTQVDVYLNDLNDGVYLVSLRSDKEILQTIKTVITR
jgi:hypothetical protein